MALEKVRIANVFRGVPIGDKEISQLLYVDNVVVLSPWIFDNARHLIRIVWCFIWIRVSKSIFIREN